MRQRILSVGMICALMLLSIAPPVGAREKDTKNGKSAGTTEAGAAEEKAEAKAENKPAAKKKVTVARRVPLPSRQCSWDRRLLSCRG